jgi:hypothetical protein
MAAAIYWMNSCQETTTRKMIGSRQHRLKVRIERRRFRSFERSFFDLWKVAFLDEATLAGEVL